MVGIGTFMAAPGQAATTVYGSAQLKYTVNATASVSIATNYQTTAPIGQQSAAAATILPSAAGNCSAGVVESIATLTFGGVTPGATPTSYTGCYYKNALSIGLNSNDSLGVKVLEYADVQVTGTQICVFNLNGTMGTAAPTTNPSVSGAAGNPAAYSGAACPTVNSVAGTPLVFNGATTAGTGFGAAGTPPGVTTDVTATPTATTTTAGGTTLYSTAAAPPVGWNFFGQDVQLNVAGNAPSGAQTNVITVAVIPN